MKNPDLQSISNPRRKYSFLAEKNLCTYYTLDETALVVVVRPGENGHFRLFKPEDCVVWDYAKPITPPVYVPYTPETFEDVWMCRRGQPGAYGRAVFKNKQGVSLVVGSSHTFVSWEDLLRNWTKEDGTPLGTLEKFPG